MTKTKLAYMAGLLDGEGCLTVLRWKRGLQAIVQMSSTSPTILRFAQKHFGGCLTWRRKYPEGWKRPGILTWNCKKAAVLLRLVRPFLILKRKQADLLLELACIQEKSRPYHRHRPERQEEIVVEIRALNKKGER